MINILCISCDNICIYLFFSSSSSSSAPRPPFPSPPSSLSSSWRWWCLWSWVRYEAAHVLKSWSKVWTLNRLICSVVRRCVAVSSGSFWKGKSPRSAPSAAPSSSWSSTPPSAKPSVTPASSWTPPACCWSALSVSTPSACHQWQINGNQM